MPDGTPLEQTTRVAQALGSHLASRPTCATTRSMRARRALITSTGWCATTICGSQPNQADIQVNLLPADVRSAQSHAIAKGCVPVSITIAQRFGARIQVGEVPPGPPVLQTLVAEVYGPESARPDRRLLTRSSRSSSRPRAWWTPTGTFEDPQQQLSIASRCSESGAARNRRGTTSRRRLRSQPPGWRRGCCTSQDAREAVPTMVEFDRAGPFQPAGAREYSPARRRWQHGFVARTGDHRAQHIAARAFITRI